MVAVPKPQQKKKRYYKTVVCNECGKEFERRTDQINRRGIFNYCGQKCANVAKFCSLECRNKWQSESSIPKGFITGADNQGEKNGRFKHGKRVGGYTQKKKVRLQVIDRDGNWCLFCGKPGPGLHLHRVIYGSQLGKYEALNCIQLCAAHHETAHSDKRHWQPILLEYINQATNGNQEWFEKYRTTYLMKGEEK